MKLYMVSKVVEGKDIKMYSGAELEDAMKYADSNSLSMVLNMELKGKNYDFYDFDDKYRGSYYPSGKQLHTVGRWI